MRGGHEAGAMPCVVCDDDCVKTVETVGDRVYYSCPVCGVTFLDPSLRLWADEERTRYGLHQNSPDDPGYRRFLRVPAEVLIDRLAPGARGLDYGCGPVPVLADMFRESGYPMAVYDPFFFSDLGPLNRSYDFIACTEAAEHFYRPLAEFKTFDRLLAPGGLLAVMTTFRNDTVDFKTWHYRRDPTHVVFYRKRTMHSLALRFGWGCTIPVPNVALLNKPRHSILIPGEAAHA